MIARIGNEDQEKLGKMKKLMDILSNPSKRLPLEVLLKCETVLEHMIRDPPPADSSPAPGIGSESSSVNPLLDAIIKLKNPRIAGGQNPMLNHSLHRTFGLPIESVCGTDITLPPPVKRRRKSPDVGEAVAIEAADDGFVSLPDVVQGEIARLKSRFKVDIDATHLAREGSILLMCSIDDKDLPSVPPISVRLPSHYPDDSSPEMQSSDLEEYQTSAFFKKVHLALQARLRMLPPRHTLTQFLNAWEMAIRAACSLKQNKNNAGKESKAIRAA